MPAMALAKRPLLVSPVCTRTTDGPFRPIALEACGLTGALSCFGDGSGAACPCGNESAPSERAGCNSSLGHGGALRASGRASLTGDTLALEGSAMPNSAVLYFQGESMEKTLAWAEGECEGFMRS